MKNLLITLTVALTLIVSVNAYAGIFDCPPGQEKKGWKCVDIETPDPEGSITVNNDNDIDISNRNTNINTNVNTNLIDVEGRFDNKNVNKNNQGQSQSTENANNSNQETTVTFNEAKAPVNYNHINTNAVTSYAATMWTNSDNIRTIGYAPLGTYTLAQARLATKDADDMNAVAVVIGDPGFDTRSIEFIDRDVTGFMGYVYVTSDGKDSNAFAGEFVAMKAAMKAGATHILFVSDDVNIIASGSSWNIGTGAGTSVSPQDSGRVMVGGTGGVGFGGAKASNLGVPSSVYKVYCDLASADIVTFKAPIGR